MTREKAFRLRGLIEKAAAFLNDQDASAAPMLFPRLKQDGSLIKAGVRIQWNGAIKRAAADLWDTEANAPDQAPALWEDIAYRDGWRIIPETITAGLAFGKGERGWWAGRLYESMLDANSWTPAQYPAGWKLIDEESAGA